MAFVGWLHLGFRNQNHHVKQLHLGLRTFPQTPGRSATRVTTNLDTRVRDKSMNREVSAQAEVLLLGGQSAN